MKWTGFLFLGGIVYLCCWNLIVNQILFTILFKQISQKYISAALCKKHLLFCPLSFFATLLLTRIVSISLFNSFCVTWARERLDFFSSSYFLLLTEKRGQKDCKFGGKYHLGFNITFAAFPTAYFLSFSLKIQENNAIFLC